jgi:hypothetical protein
MPERLLTLGLSGAVVLLLLFVAGPIVAGLFLMVLAVIAAVVFLPVTILLLPWLALIGVVLLFTRCM